LTAAAAHIAAFWPVYAIIAGVALLAAGVVLLIKNWGAVSAFFVNLWKTVTGAFTKAFNWIKNLLSGVSNKVLAVVAMFLPFIGIPALIIKNWDTIKAFFVGLWVRIRTAATAAWDGIKTFFTGLWADITAGFTDAWNNILAFFRSVLDGITQAVASVANWLSGVWAAVTGAFASAWLWVKDLFTSIWNGILAFFGFVWTGIVAVFGSAWDGITQTVASVANLVFRRLGRRYGRFCLRVAVGKRFVYLDFERHPCFLWLCLDRHSRGLWFRVGRQRANRSIGCELALRRLGRRYGRFCFRVAVGKRCVYLDMGRHKRRGVGVCGMAVAGDRRDNRAV
jgi:hypothetical protein